MESDADSGRLVSEWALQPTPGVVTPGAVEMEHVYTKACSHLNYRTRCVYLNVSMPNSRGLPAY